VVLLKLLAPSTYYKVWFQRIQNKPSCFEELCSNHPDELNKSQRK
jgi:hypothetical protein